MAQAGQSPAFHYEYATFGFGFVARFSDTRRNHGDAIMGRQLKVTGVDIRLIAMRRLNPGFQIIRNDNVRNATEKRKGPDMRHQPVIQPLGPGRLHIGVIAGAQHRNKHLSLAEFTGSAVHDRHGGTRIVHKHLLTRPMGLAHHDIGVRHPSPILLAEPGVLIALRMRGFVLFPQEPQGDAGSA